MLKELKARMKHIKTANLYLCLFSLGMGYSLTGPCLLDLQHMIRTDTRHIAMIYTARSGGYLAGAIVGGILLDLVPSKQAVMMVCNLFITVSVFGIPWCRSVVTLLITMCINGAFLGTIETGGTVICLQLWGKDSNPVFQGLHFLFGLGGLLSPLIAVPFLENTKELSQNIDNSTNFAADFYNTTANFSINVTNITDVSNGLPKIIYPFSIVGIISLLVTILNLLICIISPTEEDCPKDDSKIDNSERSFLFMFFIAILTFFLFFVVTGTEIGYAQTLTTFAVKGKLQLTTAQGSFMTAAFWAAFTVSRLICAFLSFKISSFKMIIADVCLITISALILLFLMPNEWALWLATVIYGIGIASSYASMVGWINKHIYISSKFSAIFPVGCAAGEMVVPFIIAYFIDTIPEMFSFVVTSSVILTTIILFILYCMFKRGRQVNKTNTINCYVVEITETKT